jgi:hypothetical protein
MRQATATVLCSIISVAGMSIAQCGYLGAIAASGSTEFDAPPPSSGESSDSQSGFSTAPTEPEDTSPPAVAPTVSDSAAPSVRVADSADVHDSDPVDEVKVNETAPAVERSSHCSGTATPAVRKCAPEVVPPTATAALPPDSAKPEPQLKAPIHGEKEVAPESAPTNKYVRNWRGGGFIANSVKALFDSPAEMYRNSVTEFHAGVADMTNNSQRKSLKVPAAIITLPFSMAAGCAEGISTAFKYGKTGEPAPDRVAARSTLTD